MKAITVEPGKPGTARYENIPEPDAHEGSVLVEAVAVGVCGTDVVIVECTGVGQIIADSVRAVSAGGIVCLTGVGRGGRTGNLSTADTAANIVLRNKVIVGSVNANKRHWYKAAEALARADRKWLSRLITRREKLENFKQALERQPDDIKVVIQFSEV